MSRHNSRSSEGSNIRGNFILILLIIGGIYLSQGNNLQTTLGKIQPIISLLRSDQTNQSDTLTKVGNLVQQLAQYSNQPRGNNQQGLLTNIIPPTPIPLPPKPPPISLNAAPAVIGDAQFTADWNEVFQILQTQAPHYWNYVSGKVVQIVQTPNRQHDWVNPNTGIFEVGRDVLVPNGTRAQNLIYMACALPHEACHVERGKQAQALGVQFAASAIEELVCFPIQAQCLDVLGQPELANGVRKQDGTHVYQYQQDDFSSR